MEADWAVSRPSAIERLQQGRRLLATEGRGGVARRLRARAAARLTPAGTRRLAVSREALVRSGEMTAAGIAPPPPLPHPPRDPLRLAWLCAPPGAGAGGFTTIARLIGGLRGAGHDCLLYLHDRHGWPLARHRETIAEWWPQLRGVAVHDAAQGIADAHALFATSWETAYPVLTSPARGLRLYLVQDHEPSFYPAGSEALLATATYRFGFHGVTAGRWLAQLLSNEYGMSADWFELGCDLERYRVDPDTVRCGVCVYCRPSTPRRGFELALAALEIFAQRNPSAPIHLFGERAGATPFAAIDHGLLSPAKLNALYNECVAGLVISATNVSLIPYEMLAAGCIAVVNDALHNRIVLGNEHVVYAEATPYAIADALCDLLRQPAPQRREAALAAAQSVQGASWQKAVHRVEAIVLERLQQAAPQASRQPCTQAAMQASRMLSRASSR